MKLRPPLPLNRSVVMLRDDLNLAKGGEVLRVCADVAHLYESVPGWCQCGERWWDGFDGVVQRRFWHRWITPKVSNQDRERK